MKNTLSGPGNQQTLRDGDFPEVQQALYAWFLQEQNRHTSIRGNIYYL